MMEFIWELWAYVRERRNVWLVPVLVMLALFGGLLLLTQGSAIAPFIYPLF